MIFAGWLKRPVFWWLVFAAAIVIGLGVIEYGRTLDQYADQEVGSAIYADPPCTSEEGHNDDQAWYTWYRKMDEARTLRYPLINAGCGIIVAALTLALLFGYLRKTRREGHTILRTPSQEWHFFAVGIVAIISTLIGTFVGLDLDLERQMLPWCADSIIIPMFGLIPFTLIFLLVAILVGWGISHWFKPLPASLWQWNSEKPKLSIVVSIIFGAIALFWFWMIIDSFPTADFLIVGPGILAIYLTLSCRAAILGPTKEL
jgi:hypothetical protein